MIQDLSLRNLKKTDRHHLLDLIKRTNNFTAEDKRIAIELIDECIKDENNNDYSVVCAESENKVCGFICFGAASLCIGTYDIYYIAVDPDVSGKGIGRQLINHVELLLKDIARMILIETSSSDSYEIARKFYLKLGYKEIERLKDYYKEGEDRVIYQKLIK
jgi:ribosomal protein S18 acetylase RimI-like enzyme